METLEIKNYKKLTDNVYQIDDDKMVLQILNYISANAKQDIDPKLIESSHRAMMMIHVGFTKDNEFYLTMIQYHNAEHDSGWSCIFIPAFISNDPPNLEFILTTAEKVGYDPSVIMAYIFTSVMSIADKYNYPYEINMGFAANKFAFISDREKPQNYCFILN